MPETAEPIDYVMDWDRFGRKGQFCQMLPIKGNLSSTVQVRFEDGFTGIISRRALRRPRQSEQKELLRRKSADESTLPASGQTTAGE